MKETILFTVVASVCGLFPILDPSSQGISHY
jgi:hypothetical protein